MVEVKIEDELLTAMLFFMCYVEEVQFYQLKVSMNEDTVSDFLTYVSIESRPIYARKLETRALKHIYI